MTNPEPRLTDENAHKVLARALELQAQSAGTLTVAQVREIASELSIPESAVDQALAEYRAAGAAELSPRTETGALATSRKPSRFARSVVLSLALVGGAVVLLTIFFIIMRSSASS